MEIWEVIKNNLAQTAAIIGFVFLMLEIWILGLSTILLLTFGISTLTTAFFMRIGLIPDSLTMVVSFSCIGSIILNYFSWTLLTRMQVGESRDFNIHSDFIGLTFLVSSQLDVNHPVLVKYSGINWKLVFAPSYLDSVVYAGDAVKVIGVDVGRFIVIPDNIYYK